MLSGQASEQVAVHLPLHQVAVHFACAHFPTQVVVHFALHIASHFVTRVGAPFAVQLAHLEALIAAGSHLGFETLASQHLKLVSAEVAQKSCTAANAQAEAH